MLRKKRRVDIEAKLLEIRLEQLGISFAARRIVRLMRIVAALKKPSVHNFLSEREQERRIVRETLEKVSKLWEFSNGRPHVFRSLLHNWLKTL